MNGLDLLHTDAWPVRYAIQRCSARIKPTLTADRPPHWTRPKNAVRQEAVAMLYERGCSIAQIAARMKLGRETVRADLVVAGVERRPVGRRGL